MALIKKMVFVENNFDEDTFQRFLNDYEVIERTDYGTYEIWSHNIRTFEDVIAEGESLTEDEGSDWEYPTSDDRYYLKDMIGEDVYDMLLNQELDFVLIAEEF